MRLPVIDLEMEYWRVRRTFQRVRWSWHAFGIRARAQAHLEYLCMFGKLPDAPEPEATITFRALWALSIGMVVAVLAFGHEMEPKGPENAAAMHQAVTQAHEMSADTDVLKPALRREYGCV